ncbi:MAG: type II toxin-antitoxin system VapC family toxin [Desulfatiglandaceae bacterium]|jgi:toxin FitB
MNFLIDTCVISEIIKAKPSKRVVEWVGKQNEEFLYLSVLTLGEIHKGIEKLDDIDRKKNLHLWVECDLRERFRDRILPIDSQVAMIWGQIQGKAEKTGQGMPAIDGLIAATGLAHDLVVVTRNVSDMEISGVALLNPWE